MYGGDIRDTLDNMKLFKIQEPKDPVINFTSICNYAGKFTTTPREQDPYMDN